MSKVRVGYHRSENTETASSPLTYAHCPNGSAPATTQPDHPVFANMKIESAVAGLPAGFLSQPATTGVNEEESPATSAATDVMGTSGFPSTTRHVETLSVDITGISPPIANLFRRLITTEVPTLAMDRVLIEENDSVVLDELLSHRLGLLPIVGPVDKMEYLTDSQQSNFEYLDPKRVILFELEAVGSRQASLTPVYSRQLKWVPLPGQESWAENEEDQVFLVHPDILLTKLGPGQQLKLRAMAVKGLGIVHSKWSPVSSCYYEMRSSIGFSQPITGEDAKTLAKICPRNVFEVDGSSGKAVVLDVERCTLCRECLRTDAYPTIAEKIRIEKDKTAVRFHIESTGQRNVRSILQLALKLFAERCRDLAERVRSCEVNSQDVANSELLPSS